MLKQEQVKTPELDKMQAVQADSQKIGEFLEWLYEQDIELAKWDEPAAELLDINLSGQELTAQYYGIDLVKCEQERRALLAAVREDNYGKR